jgi:RimJ/RimL family protein N-acetyltransferase
MMDVLTAGPFTLRSPTANDVVWLCDACGDREVQRWTRVPDPYLPRHALEFAAAAAEQARLGTGLAYLIELTDSGELLGCCGLAHIEGGTSELGYWLAPDGRGRGAATTAVMRMVELAGAHGVTLLYATPLVGNERSERVLARCGFVCVDREALCDQRGNQMPASRWERRVP